VAEAKAQYYWQCFKPYASFEVTKPVGLAWMNSYNLKHSYFCIEHRTLALINLPCWWPDNGGAKAVKKEKLFEQRKALRYRKTSITNEL